MTCSRRVRRVKSVVIAIGAANAGTNKPCLSAEFGHGRSMGGTTGGRMHDAATDATCGVECLTRGWHGTMPHRGDPHAS